MQHNFVFNHLSLPAASRNEAYELLLDTMKGMLAVSDSEDDRYAIFSDHKEKLVKLNLAEGYSYNDFIDELGEKGEGDLQLVLFEVEDKTPMFDHVSDATTEAMLDSIYYFPDEAYTGTIDILGLAWNIDAIVLSIATSERWRLDEIKFAEYPAETLDHCSYLQNISTKAHGVEMRRQREELRLGSLSEQFGLCKFDDHFLAWYEDQHDLLKARIRTKLHLASSKKFAGGKPLFDTLTDAGGIREMRFSNVEGGAVRILFKAINNNSFGILTGFIKKSDNEGYDQAIVAADAAFEKMKS